LGRCCSSRFGGGAFPGKFCFPCFSEAFLFGVFPRFALSSGFSGRACFEVRAFIRLWVLRPWQGFCLFGTVRGHFFGGCSFRGHNKQVFRGGFSSYVQAEPKTRRLRCSGKGRNPVLPKTRSNKSFEWDAKNAAHFRRPSIPTLCFLVKP